MTAVGKCGIVGGEIKIKSGINVITLPHRDARVEVKKLGRIVRRYERRYEISSADMAKKLRSQTERETATH